MKLETSVAARVTNRANLRDTILSYRTIQALFTAVETLLIFACKSSQSTSVSTPKSISHARFGLARAAELLIVLGHEHHFVAFEESIFLDRGELG